MHTAREAHGGRWPAGRSRVEVRGGKPNVFVEAIFDGAENLELGERDGSGVQLVLPRHLRWCDQQGNRTLLGPNSISERKTH